MSAFTDQVDVDNGAVFLNLEEYGAATVVNGVTITAVFDTDLNQPRVTGAPEIENVVSDQARLFAAVDGFPSPLNMGGTLEIGVDPEPWNVTLISEEIGIYVISLNRPRSSWSR